MIDNITKSYKISKEDLAKLINDESEKLIDREIYKNNKIPKNTESDAFNTVKDHKKQFPLNIECKLLNPGKNHISRISKKILENIVYKVRLATKLLQWKNSSEVIRWFDKIGQKNGKCFIVFDI